MNKKFALLTVFLVVLIDLMGFGIVLPLLPFYASKFGASPVAVGLLYSVYSLAQLLFSPIWGSLSDRIGRKPVMLFSTLGSTLSYILFSFSHSFGMLITSRILAGVMGGNISTAQAYIADVTTPEERTKGMGLIGAAFGIGFVLGPAIATMLVHPKFHDFLMRSAGNGPLEFFSGNIYSLPGIFAAMLSFASLILVLTQLPETAKRGGAGPAMRPSVFTKKFWTSLAAQSAETSGKILPMLFASVFLISIGHSSLYSAFPLYCKTALGFSAEKVGTQFVMMGLVAVLIQGWLIHRLTRRFGEKRLFLAGGALMAWAMALIPSASSEKSLTLILALLAVGGSLNGPTLNSMISKQALPEKMGAMMGSSQSLSALGRAIGPSWGGFLFGLWLPLPFLLTAGLVSLTIWLALRLKNDP